MTNFSMFTGRTPELRIVAELHRDLQATEDGKTWESCIVEFQVFTPESRHTFTQAYPVELLRSRLECIVEDMRRELVDHIKKWEGKRT